MLGKIHRATITAARADYAGSLSICPDLLSASGILPYERVDVYNLDNGERLQTYALVGEPGEICLNGAAALKGAAGQKVIIAAYGWLLPNEYSSLHPKVVCVDENNKPVNNPAKDPARRS